MTTRLDRLFLLLDTGSTPVTRQAAAQQLGEVQKLHPHELHNLLAKIHFYLRSSTWETRIAAGQAIEAVAKHVPHWAPIKKIKEEGSVGSSGPRIATPVHQEREADQLKFDKFDVNRVLRHGSSLLGSAGTEYELDLEETGLDPKERLIKQRRLLQKRLGLDVGGVLGMDSEELFNDEDLLIKKEATAKADSNTLKLPTSAADIVAQEMAQMGAGLSSREKNRAKRKAKQLLKQRSKENTDATCMGSGLENMADEPVGKKAKIVKVSSQSSFSDKPQSDQPADSNIFYEEPGEWPFASFCEQLSTDLFHQSWEVRHGAATGIREVVKVHGQSAGKSVDQPLDQQESLNQMWMEDMALRLLCVLTLDRFGDFVSDEVVAPVRETCAQALGVVLHHMTTAGVHGVLGVLLQLLSQEQWEVRHGGLLGMKYLLAVRKEMTDELLPAVLPSIVHGLQDEDDDVRAVAAASLNPVAGALIRVCHAQVPTILSTLWDTLLELDDLTASTNSIMTLLASLHSYPAALVCHGQSTTTLMPRLWPFLRHNITSVRRAVLETLCTLLLADHQQVPTDVWLPPVLQDALRHIFQRCILESNPDILALIDKVWDALLEKSPLDMLVTASCPYISAWMCLAMQPSRVPIDVNMLIEAKHKVKESKGLSKSWKSQQTVKEDDRKYIGGDTSLSASVTERESVVLQARIRAARLLGRVAPYITSHRLSAEFNACESLAQILIFHLKSKSAIQRMVIGLIIEEWAQTRKEFQCPGAVKAKLLEILSCTMYFDEVSVPFMKMQSECKMLISAWCDVRKDVQPVQFPSAFTVEQANALSESIQGQLSQAGLPARTSQDIQQRCKHIQGSIEEINTEQQILSTRTQACLASAVIASKSLPEKLNPIIKPLMDSIKKEQITIMQSHAANSLASLLEQCTSRNPCPSPKIIKNLCSSLCSDPNVTPNAAQPLGSLDLTRPPVFSKASVAGCAAGSRPSSPLPGAVTTVQCDKRVGILTLAKQQQIAAITAASRRAAYARSRSKESSSFSETGLFLDPSILTEGSSPQSQLQHRGAKSALTTIARRFGMDLITGAGKLWELMTAPLLEHLQPSKFDAILLEDKDDLAQELINSLQVFEVLCPAVHPNLHPKLTGLLPNLIQCLQHPYTAVRHVAASSLGALGQVATAETMNRVLADVLPLLGVADSATRREGSVEAMMCLIERLGMGVVPYIVLLVVPLLGRMSDQVESVRLTATHCFATLIRLMPLEAGIPDPPAMAVSLVKQKARERRFLEQLLDSKKLDSYEVPVTIKAELRKYQQDGVNWLAFLNKYKLHGILCDDMGLGKTLQSICIMAGDHYLRERAHKKTQHADAAPLSSIVICPPTLTGHWVFEIEKFCSREYLHPLHYTGPPTERQTLRSRVKKHNLVVVSYDIVRNDIDFFKTIQWNYCILDEGHIIKNGKTKLAKAIKQLSAAHRLILSGTPIQNNVLELWSLFDFLMPGYLGTEKQFTARYAKPIIQSRDAKSSSKEQESGALAMESLHRQVLPFLLRRLKEDVLDDLPPKIIQDYYCELSALQVQLYEDFAKSRAKKGVEASIDSPEEGESQAKPLAPATSHIFQALQYLRKVCNHPLLVLNKKHPQYDNITAQLSAQNTSLHDIAHAPKLTALKQLLQDCGIGVEVMVSEQEGLTEAVVGQHRVLLFCQLKSMLDIVEKDLLRKHLPNVTYLRLDGSVPAGQRHDIVHRFNNDPSIDILLLTTHVGGLGLNLTGADTVIFVEHDWNPTRDLQAMDRAHRIGQKRVVNVYRLITRGTLEEKIMGLQKFKMNIANTVITQDNSSLQSMGTDQLLDLFSLDQKRPGGFEESKQEASSSFAGSKAKQTASSVLQGLSELWDEKQYETEYNLDSFMQSLSS
ncbi:TATA-binding protein-associated factor 172-like isoform X2 [Acanthaster planci]|uniref:TATA-binding protein-associated factor 172-like isoform X2 n=1 Tax=Acanthaster planci TaxID=133434 RepID=A0A8B7XJN3_ACAPL|nr:TATA-binding protein-associated factor 172-like isoform X2 [Acanthaster planci]